MKHNASDKWNMEMGNAFALFRRAASCEKWAHPI